MTTCKKCGRDIISWETWYFHGEEYCERCFNELVHEAIIKKKKANNDTAVLD